ncbi:uncharacterized protein [Macrobrachium rosenbergii]|uniref:uncharacterized protein n=1 Tax=Macrobrachium rosenbergii TaxID=79674 RepID=UPI0034D6189B
MTKSLASHQNHLSATSTATQLYHSSSFKKLELQERTNNDSLKSGLGQTQGQSKPLWFMPTNINNNTNSVLRNFTSVNNFDHMQVSKTGSDSDSDLTEDYSLHGHSKSIAYNALPFHLNAYQALLTGAKIPLKNNSSITRTSRMRSTPLTSRVANFGWIRNKRQNPVYLVQLQPRPVRVVQKKISSPLNLINILSFGSRNDGKQLKSFPPKSTSSQVSAFSFTDTVNSIPSPTSDSEVPDLVSVLSAAPPPVQKIRKAITREITDSDVTQVLAFLSRTIPSVNRRSKTKVEHIFTMKPSLDSNIPVTFRPSPRDPFLTPAEDNQVSNNHNSSSVNTGPSSFPLPSFTPSLPRFSQEPLPDKIDSRKRILLHQNTLGPIPSAAPVVLTTNESSSFATEVNNSSTSFERKPENKSTSFFPTYSSSLFLQGQFANSVLDNQNVHTLKQERPSRKLLPPTSSFGELPPFVEGVHMPTTPTFEHSAHNIADLKFLFNPSLKESLLSKNVAGNQMPKFPGPVFGPWKPITSPPKVLSSAGGDSEKEENLIFTDENAQQEGDISISTDLKPNIFSPTRNLSQTGALIFKDQNFLYISMFTPENQSIFVTEPSTEPELLTQLKLKSTSSIVSDASVQPLSHAITGQYVPQSHKEELHRPQTFIQTQNALQQNQAYKDKPIVQSHPQNLSHALNAVPQRYQGNDLQDQNMFMTAKNINLDPHNQPITKIQEHSGLQLLFNSQFQPENPANEQQTKFQSDQKVQTKPEVQQFQQGQLQTHVGSESQGEYRDEQQPQIKLQMQSQLQSHFQSEPQIQLQSEVHLPLMSHSEFKHQTESHVEQEAQSQSEKQKGDFQSPSDIQLEPNLQTKPQLQSTQLYLTTQPQSEAAPHVESHGISETQFPLMQEVLLKDHIHIDSKPQLQTENMLKHLFHSQPSDGLGQEVQSGPQFQVQPHIQPKLQLLPNRDFLSEEISHMKSQFHSEPQPLFAQQVKTEVRLDSEPQNEDSLPMQPSSEAAKQKDYEFSWTVSEPRSLLQYGHREKRLLGKTDGLYHVLLPDGRIQTVRYTADGNGYKANISYAAE